MVHFGITLRTLPSSKGLPLGTEAPCSPLEGGTVMLGRGNLSCALSPYLFRAFFSESGSTRTYDGVSSNISLYFTLE